jgi:hypothetical protein
MSISLISTLCRGSNTAFGITNEDARWLAGKERGVIKFSDFYSKPVPGSRTYSTPGTYTFLVPAHESLSVDVRGAGGGGGGGGYWFNAILAGGPIVAACGNPGGPGSSSSFGNVIANGGDAGSNGCGLTRGADGEDGGGSGGSVTTGGGSAGGAGGVANRNQGVGDQGFGGNGGGGGRTTKTYTFLAIGSLAWKDSVTIVVGTGGFGGPTIPAITPAGNPGAHGQVTVTWS